MKKIVVIVFLLIFSVNLFSQERTGIANSFYAGQNGVALNPAFMVGTMYEWDINIATAHLFADNNYFFLGNTNLLKLRNASSSINITASQNPDIIGTNTYNVLAGHTNHNFDKRVHSHVLAQGPSAMLSRGKWAFGFSMALRGAVAVTNINDEFAENMFSYSLNEQWNSNELLLPNMNTNSLIWNEIGLTAAHEIYNSRSYIVKVGATLKSLRGHAAAFVHNDSPDLMYHTADESFNFSQLQINTGFSVSDFENSRYAQIMGWGMGLDLGITIEKRGRNAVVCPTACRAENELAYRWKLGVSLIDWGSIAFKKEAESYMLRDTLGDWSNPEWPDVETTGAVHQEMMNRFYLARYRSFKMKTPRAISAQFDYNFGYHIYANATVVQRIPTIKHPGVQRTNLLAFSVRYDTPRFGAAITSGFYEYHQFRYGVALRLGNYLVLGTENLEALTGSKITGADFYISLKVNKLVRCSRNKHERTAVPCSQNFR